MDVIIKTGGYATTLQRECLLKGCSMNRIGHSLEVLSDCFHGGNDQKHFDPDPLLCSRHLRFLEWFSRLLSRRFYGGNGV